MGLCMGAEAGSTSRPLDHQKFNVKGRQTIIEQTLNTWLLGPVGTSAVPPSINCGSVLHPHAQNTRLSGTQR